MVAQLRQCIRLNLDCADVCEATGRLASRQTGTNETVLRAMLKTCEEACARCAEECARHANHMEHCAICAETCRRCEAACKNAAGSFGAQHLAYLRISSAYCRADTAARPSLARVA
jgi:hypothetical protein